MWTNAALSLFRPLGTYINENWIMIQQFSYKKIKNVVCKMVSILLRSQSAFTMNRLSRHIPSPASEESIKIRCDIPFTYTVFSKKYETLMLEQNNQCFSNIVIKHIIFTRNYCIVIQISMRCVAQVQTTNVALSLFRLLGTFISENWIMIQQFSYKKIKNVVCKMASILLRS